MGQQSAQHLRQVLSGPAFAIIYRQNQAPQITKQYTKKRTWQQLQSMVKIFDQRRLSGSMGRGDDIFYGIDKRKKLFVVKCPLYTDSNIFSTSPQVIQQERKRLLQQFIHAIFRSEPFYFYSYENIFYDGQKKTLMFNPISLAGLLPIILKKKMRKAELKQVYELLDLEMFGDCQDKWCLVTHKAKFRAIGMFILDTILGRRVSLLDEKYCDYEEIDLGKVKVLINEIPARFSNLLEDKDILQKIQDAMKEDNNVNYLGFLRRVFQFDCQNLEWNEAISMLFHTHSCQFYSQLKLSLDCLAKRLFVAEDISSKKRLVVLGIAKIIKESFQDEGQIILDYGSNDIYLNYLLQSGSFKYVSVAHQISHTKDPKTIITQIKELIEKKIKEPPITTRTSQPTTTRPSSSNPNPPIPKRVQIKQPNQNDKEQEDEVIITQLDLGEQQKYQLEMRQQHKDNRQEALRQTYAWRVYIEECLNGYI